MPLGDGGPTSACSTHALRLLEAVRETPDFNDFRIRRPKKFCGFGLDKSNSGRFTFTRSRHYGGDALQALPLTPSLCERLIHLMTILENTGAFRLEGVFRKTGNLAQQRNVTEALVRPHFDCQAFDWSVFSPHELAGALKSIIGHLTPPLLTATLMPLFLEAARLWDCEPVGRQEAEGMQPRELLPYAKQVKSLRLLVQLLPPLNRSLLQRFLRLLSLVSKHVTQSRMTHAALGTVFGPVFAPLAVPQSRGASRSRGFEDFKRSYQEGIFLATRLIQLSDELFLLPASLLEDIRHNMKGSSETETEERRAMPRCSPYRRRKHSRRSCSPLQTSIRFASLSSATTASLPKASSADDGP